MNKNSVNQTPKSNLLDLALVVHTTAFLSLYVSDAVLAFRPYVPIFAWPVEMFFLMLAPVLLRVHLPDYRNSGLRRSLQLWRSHAAVLAPLLILVVWNALTAMQSGTNISYGQGKAIYILLYRFVMFAGSLSVAIFLISFGWRRTFLLIFVILVGSILYDVAYPGTFSSVISRAGGFQQNPNLAAIGTLLLLAVVVRYDRVHLADLMLIFLGFIAVFSTLSRGGILMFAILLINYLWLTGRGQRLKQIIIVPIIIGAMYVSGFLAIDTLTTSSSMFDADNAQRRLATLTFDSGATYESDDVRLDLVPQYLQLIDDAVITGYGPGFTRTMPFGPHNTYLLVWVENGLIGLSLYVWFVFSLLGFFVVRRFWPGVVFMQVALIAGFFTHNVLHLPIFMIPAGILLGVSWVMTQVGVSDRKLRPALNNDLLDSRSLSA